jgi:hypothetical protein
MVSAIALVVGSLIIFTVLVITSPHDSNIFPYGMLFLFVIVCCVIIAPMKYIKDMLEIERNEGGNML